MEHGATSAEKPVLELQDAGHPPRSLVSLPLSPSLAPQPGHEAATTVQEVQSMGRPSCHRKVRCLWIMQARCSGSWGSPAGTRMYQRKRLMNVSAARATATLQRQASSLSCDMPACSVCVLISTKQHHGRSQRPGPRHGSQNICKRLQLAKPCRKAGRH